MESAPDSKPIQPPVSNKKESVLKKLIIEDSSDSDNEEPRSGKSSVDGKKYSLFEDWTILQTLKHYKDINGSYGLSSPHLWNNLRYQRQLLGGTRTAMSMRNRYTKLKEDLTEENLEKIKKFIEKNGELEMKNYYLRFRQGRVSIADLSMYEARKRHKKNKTPPDSGKKSVFYQRLVERMSTTKKNKDEDIESGNNSSNKKVVASSMKKAPAPTGDEDDICNLPERELRLKKVKVQLFKTKNENHSNGNN